VEAERLGLFGGTFDPPHFGHLQVAQEAVERLALSRLLFVVAGSPPHKRGKTLSSPRRRVEMTRQAVTGNPAFQVSEMELERDGPSYTVDTLRGVREEHPGARLFFLLGADQLAEFHEWKEPGEIARLATVVVVARDGVAPKDLPPVDLGDGRILEFKVLPVIRMDISSSDLRCRAREGRSLRYMVPPGVRRVIESQGLYR
jgi:nicotinate-nucleotide adenylyltransferase